MLWARALIAMNRPDDARRLLEHWRPRVQQVVDWQSETEAYTSADPAGFPVTTGSDKRRSLYFASAKEVVAAIDAELARINAQAASPAH